jgi:hypothetical protein
MAAMRGLELRERFGRGGSDGVAKWARRLAVGKPGSDKDVTAIGSCSKRRAVDSRPRRTVAETRMIRPPAMLRGCGGAATPANAGPTQNRRNGNVIETGLGGTTR